MSVCVCFIIIVLVTFNRGYCYETNPFLDNQPNNDSTSSTLEREKLLDLQLNLPTGLQKLWKSRLPNMHNTSQYNRLHSKKETTISAENIVSSDEEDSSTTFSPLWVSIARSSQNNSVHFENINLYAERQTINPSCLQSSFCHKDFDAINFALLEIYHSDLPERSAAACGQLCIQLHPTKELVFTKLVPINEMLVCGCGDLEAIIGQDGYVDDSKCLLCPDGNQKCGSFFHVSVYELDRTREECISFPTTYAPSFTPDFITTYDPTGPTTLTSNAATITTPGPFTGQPTVAGLTYWGCLDGFEVNFADFYVLLNRGRRMVVECEVACTSSLLSITHIILTTINMPGDASYVYCMCSQGDVPEEVNVDAGVSGCGSPCLDGDGWCGGPGLYTVYSFDTSTSTISKSMLDTSTSTTSKSTFDTSTSTTDTSKSTATSSMNLMTGSTMFLLVLLTLF